MRRVAQPVPLFKRLRRYARYLLVRAALWCVGRLNLATASHLGATFGGLAFRLAAAERSKAYRSMEIGLPHLSGEERYELVRDCFKHLGRAAFELACIEQLDAHVDDWVDWPKPDRDVLDHALARGKGVVFVSGHVGNWELLARRVALAGYPCNTIAKEASDPHTTALIEGFRASANLKSIWRGKSGAAKEMLRVLKSGGILGLLIDQDTKVQSVWVPFFGQPAKTPRAAADLALRTGAAVVLGFCQRDDDRRYRLSMREVPLPTEGDEEAKVLALTAAMSFGIETAIRTHPEQWVWMHQRWKSPPQT